MLEFNNKKVNYSICKYKYRLINGKIVLCNLDNNNFFKIDEKVQSIWNILVATYRGNCDITDIMISKYITMEFKLHIDMMMETIQYVDVIIEQFIAMKLICIC